MKSLIRKNKLASEACCTPKVQAAAPEKVAQCCAKVSTAVAGCHD